MGSPTEKPTTLSTTAKLLTWSVIPTTLAILAAASPNTALLSIPVLSIPVVFLRRCCLQEPTNVGHLETLLWTLLASGTIGLGIVATIQGRLCQQLAHFLFGSQASEYFKEFTRSNVADLSDAETQRRAQMAWTWEYFVFLLVFAFGLAGFLEETLKYLAIIIARRRGCVRDERQYIQVAIAATLGFSTVENIGFVYAARGESVTMLAVTLFERLALGMPAHALSGCLLALSIVRRDLRKEAVGWLQIFGFPILYHGLWDFSLFAISAANGNIGWVHPKDPASLALGASVVVGISLAAFWHVRCEMKRLGVIL